VTKSRSGGGDLFVAGSPEVEIGDTLADPADSATAALSGSRRTGVADDLRGQHLPLAGRSGSLLTTSDPERLRGGLGERVDSDRAHLLTEVIEVAGRGELQLAVLTSRCDGRDSSSR
jgi:predicted membrane GTPase involved in stress response